MNEISLDKIIPYENNAKEHNTKQIKQIGNSIKKFGFNQAIIVDKEMVIIVGHGRLLGAKQIGITKARIGMGSAPIGADWAPVIKLDSISDDDAKAYRLGDNKLNESLWITKNLIKELEGLNLKGIDIAITGFDQDFLTGLKEDDFDGQKEYDKINVPKTKTGDIYKLGDHRIMCGDSTSIDDFNKLMDGKKADLIFTDPPYGVDYKSPGGLDYASKKFGGTGGKIFNDDKTEAESMAFFTKALEVLKEITTDECPIYWWFANKNNYINRQAFMASGWYMSQIIIWVKNSMIYSQGQDYHRQYEPCMFGWKKGQKHYTNKKIANYKDVFALGYDDFKEAVDQFCDVWYQKRDVTANYVHPTQKPVRLAERALKKNSQAGDIVVDAFIGSGSTLIGCQQMGRSFYGMELDPKYMDVVIKRWEQFTNKKAVKI